MRPVVRIGAAVTAVGASTTATLRFVRIPMAQAVFAPSLVSAGMVSAVLAIPTHSSRCALRKTSSFTLLAQTASRRKEAVVRPTQAMLAGMAAAAYRSVSLRAETLCDRQAG